MTIYFQVRSMLLYTDLIKIFEQRENGPKKDYFSGQFVRHTHTILVTVLKINIQINTCVTTLG
jgi:hypothetical protein